jgi:RimJ/RimL family protein N-acetyltransferase
MLDRLALPPVPTLRGERVILRGSRESDIDDRLRYPIDPEEEDGYGSAWRREWDGRRYDTREDLAGDGGPPDPGTYGWAIEYDGECIGSARLVVDPDQHCATYSVGVFVADLRGRGLGREVTRLVVAWGFDVLGVHRIQLEVLASNRRAINCYVACGFRREGVRREAQLYPDGWKDFILMGLFAVRAREARMTPLEQGGRPRLIQAVRLGIRAAMMETHTREGARVRVTRIHAPATKEYRRRRVEPES